MRFSFVAGALIAMIVMLESVNAPAWGYGRQSHPYPNLHRTAPPPQAITAWLLGDPSHRSGSGARGAAVSGSIGR
jgi:hypothetical protein